MFGLWGIKMWLKEIKEMVNRYYELVAKIHEMELCDFYGVYGYDEAEYDRLVEERDALAELLDKKVSKSQFYFN